MDILDNSKIFAAYSGLTLSQFYFAIFVKSATKYFFKRDHVFGQIKFSSIPNKPKRIPEVSRAYTELGFPNLSFPSIY